VKPAPFVHHAPRTVDETGAVLAEVGHDGKVLAGGQSLIPVLNMRLASPGHLVDINGVTGLDAVHVTDAAGALLWTDDHQPPTAPSTWGDAEVTYRRAMFVPRATTAGRVRIEAGVFSRADGVRVPMAAANPSTSLFEVMRASNDLFVVFGDGWHGAERVEQRQANEWRWSKGDARLSFRRPQRNAVLSLEIDQPVTQVGRQSVELRVGSDLLATLDVEPGARRIHRTSLPAGRLGSGPTVELDLHVRPTFVPATMTGLGGQDTRELGVRVFNVHVGPAP